MVKPSFLLGWSKSSFRCPLNSPSLSAWIGGSNYLLNTKIIKLHKCAFPFVGTGLFFYTQNPACERHCPVPKAILFGMRNSRTDDSPHVSRPLLLGERGPFYYVKHHNTALLLTIEELRDEVQSQGLWSPLEISLSTFGVQGGGKFI